MIERIYLNRDWLFDDGKTKTQVSIPHTVKELPFNYIDEESYQFVSTYTKDLVIDKKYQNKHLFLTFDGVAQKTEVYLNDKLLLTHLCGYDRFKIDLKDHYEYGKKNLLKVVVDSRESLNIPPFGNVVDYLTYGGIYRDVYLDVSNEAYVKDVFVKPIHEHNEWLVDLDIELSKPTAYDLVITYNDSVVIKQNHQTKEVLDKVRITFDYPKLWDICSPNLYKLIVFIGDDKYETTFGLRTCKFKNDGFYLNDKKVKIRGLNRHQSFPYVGYAMPRSMQELDARILKNELHVNAARTSHYHQSEYFINECDRLGLLVFTESPGWQHLGNDEWKDQVVKNVESLVLQYRNHPSIILWGVRVNESSDDHELYTRTNKLARELDPTRQTGGVRCYKKGEILEDVYTYNDFLDPNEERGLSIKEDVVGADVPYLVSEYNGHMYPVKMYDPEPNRVEQLRRLAKGMNEFYGDDKITGFFAWCMFDYNTHKDFGGGDRICYHGVLDMFRNPKFASYLYSSQGEEDYLEVASHYNLGDYPANYLEGIYALTNADELKLYKNGEYIRSYNKEDARFKNIPHPPIFINDFVGDQLVNKEGFTKKVSDDMKSVLFATLKYGNKMPLKYKLKYLKLMLFHGVNYEMGYKLYGKYIGNWGSKEVTYTVEGYRNGKLFKTVNLSRTKELSIKTNVSSYELKEEETYDVALVRLKASDQNGNVLPYYNDPFTVEASGAIDIIGPKVLSFMGGYSGIYVKSNGKKGKGTLKILSPLGNQDISFDVK